MTILESYLDVGVLREAISQASQEQADDTDVFNGVITDVVREKEPNSILLFVAALLVLIAPIAGCAMWFASVPIGINITILALAGIVGGIFFCLSEPRDFSENIGVDIVCSIIACVLHALFYLLVTAILVAIIEGILWIGTWIF